jgi:hypothetical protein
VDSQIVPNSGIASGLGSSSSEHRDFRKICAKFSCGVRFGVGFVPERSCGTECATCMGSAFERKCRFFNFRPHFDVKLEQKECQPMVNVGASQAFLVVLRPNMPYCRVLKIHTMASGRILFTCPYL